jgi:transcriptional regulator with XRE-family HTH domain
VDQVTRRAIGVRLRALREDAGYTRDYVAHRMFVSRQAVTNWELGYRNPSYETVEQFCRAIGARIHIGLDDQAHTGTNERT